jgi:hypothetical protein
VPFQLSPESSVIVTLEPLMTPVNEWLSLRACVGSDRLVYASDSVPVTAFPVRVHWMKRAPFEATARKPRCDEAEGVCVGFGGSGSLADGVLPPPPQPVSTSVAATPHTSMLTPTREVGVITLLSIVGLLGANRASPSSGSKATASGSR